VRTIKKMTVTAMRVPMQQPHRTAGGVVEESPLVAIDIEMDDGLVGHGLIFTYTVAALKPTVMLIANLEPLIVGKPLAPQSIERELESKFRLLGSQGLVGMALAGIDMALWDAMARERQCSLARLLGFSPRRIEAYGAVGFDGVAGSAVTAANWIKQGFKGVKAKIGYASVAEDVAVIRAIRSEIGPDHALMLDYNQSLTPVDAINRMRILDQEGITWVEEPTLAHDYSGHARISQASITPIQCGENWWGIGDMQKAIEADASDFMMLDVMKIGGVTGWMRAAALGVSHQIRISSHLWPEISAQLLSATPTVHWLEYANWWNEVVEEPLQLDQGVAVTSDAPGSGVKWRAGVLDKYRV
jgi:mandelate racemase